MPPARVDDRGLRLFVVDRLGHTAQHDMILDVVVGHVLKLVNILVVLVCINRVAKYSVLAVKYIVS
jgi:hypothetical protein